MLTGYDKDIKDLIAELNRSGHVTHSKHKKTSVTFHHNAGVNITHEEILHLWMFRPVSAQFDVDEHGHIAQYVEADEYAWAVGNTQGNEETISIELTNSTAGPHWEVSEVTWTAGARLAGYLFAHVIRERPTRANVFPHHHWSSTTCPGPYIDRVFDEIVKTVQDFYLEFTKNPAKKAAKKAATPVHSAMSTTEKRISDIQKAVGLTGKEVDGKWGRNTDHAVLSFRKQHLKF